MIPATANDKAGSSAGASQPSNAHFSAIVDTSAQSHDISAISADYLKTHPEVAKRIMDIMRAGLDESSPHRQWFLNAPEAKDMYIFIALGTAFDEKVKEDTLASDIYVSRSANNEVQCVMSMSEPGKTYDGGEAKNRYEDSMRKILDSIPGRTEWFDCTLKPAADRLKGSLHTDEKEHIHLSWLETAAESRGQGHGGALLDGLNELSKQTGTPVYLLCPSERAMHLYERKGFEVTRTEHFASPDEGDCQISAMEYIPTTAASEEPEKASS